MSCDKTSISITPCEFPLANDECPIGYTSTNCINFVGNDDNVTGVINGELLTTTLNKITTFVKERTINSINSNTVNVTKTLNENGINYGLEVKVSQDTENQLIYGSDGLLYSIPYHGELLEDSNTIDLKRTSTNKIQGDVRYVQTPTVNLSSTPSGLKADITTAVMNRIQILENKVAQLENSI